MSRARDSKIRNVGWSVAASFSEFLGFFCSSCPNALVSLYHHCPYPPATSLAVYPALFFLGAKSLSYSYAVTPTTFHLLFRTYVTRPAISHSAVEQDSRIFADRRITAIIFFRAHIKIRFKSSFQNQISFGSSPIIPNTFHLLLFFFLLRFPLSILATFLHPF